jgi:hypothetical protein
MDEIQIVCPVKGHEGESVTYKGAGWKYKHLRLWEEAVSGANLAIVVTERIEHWDLKDESGAEIKFEPLKNVKNKSPKKDEDSATMVLVPNESALDDLPPAMASWLVTSYREAYRRAGAADPNG